MKYLAWVIGILVGVLAIVYVFAFTSVGNSILKPIIESKIQEQIKLQSKLDTFSLSMNDFEVALEINPDNNIFIKGNYSLFSQALNVVYRVKLDDLKALKPLTNAPLQGAFRTEGTVKGSMESMKVEGKSNIGGSKTVYKVDLKDFQPKQIIASIEGAKISKLLYMAGQPNFASSTLDADIKLTSLDPKNLAGIVELSLSKGLINSAVMKKAYKVNIPKTTFSSKAHLKLEGKDIDYNMWFKSNLASIGSSGNIAPESMATDLIYALDIKELAVLKPVTGADLRGAFNLKGKVKGDKKKLIVNGKSDVALSDTNFEAILKDFAPISVKANIKNLQLANVLYMLKQPSYASGLFSLDANIADARSGKLKGSVVTNVKKGLFNSKQMTKEFKFKTPMPRASFVMDTVSKLDGNLVDTKVNFDSSLANFDVKKARFDISDSSIKSDYLVKISNLDKLFFASQRHLKGSIKVNGEFKKAKDLDLSIYSKVVGGVVDAKLHNDDFSADLKSLQTLDALEMLVYPKIFKSTLNGKLNYNLAKEKGKFKADLTDGKFTKNQMLTLIKQFGQIDLYKDNFKGDVVADINKEKIVASLDLRSNTSSIITKNTKLNSKTQVINSTIAVVANKHPITVSLTGKATSPKVSVDMEDLIKSQVNKTIEKEALRFLKKLF